MTDAAAIELLEREDNYRVLRRLVPIGGPETAREGLNCGLFIDCETTGLNTQTDSIIEFAMVPFSFNKAGEVFGAGLGGSWYEDPGAPLAESITALTGITDEMVRGQRIDDDAVAAAVASADIIIAHHAEFDRPLVERRFPAFTEKAWACSYREVDWKAFGCPCSKLEHLLMDVCRRFYDAHSALNDCHAGVYLLTAAEREGRSALSYLLESARQPIARVQAVGAPFEVKDALKSRGYRWSGKPPWTRDIPAVDADAEVSWLEENARCRPIVTKLTARDRYSVRAA